MTTKKLTLRDIAKMVGVSYATVSRALSGASGISEETRRKVLKVCEEQGYTSNFMARSLVAKESRMIGLIVGSIDNPFMGQLACHIELCARQRGYNVILSNSTNQSQQEAEVFALLMGRQVDGIIIVPANSSSSKTLEKYLSQIPTVFFGENLKDLRYNYVTVDNYHGTFLGTEYLISLGHRHIAYIGRREGSTTHQLRGEGYLAACLQHGLQPDFYDNICAPSSSVQKGYELGKAFFARPPRHTAIFAATDTTALGLMQAADEHNIKIPQDISLIGFDDIPFSQLPRIHLTTINQPLPTMAKAAVDMLVEKIREPSIGYFHQVLAPTLVKRATCIPINPQP